MSPYGSFDSYATPPSYKGTSHGHHRSNGNQEDVIFNLTERLRSCEAEARDLCLEKAELEHQLTLRGNPIKLDTAYEDLLTHVKRREEEFRSEYKKQDARILELERENYKMKDQVRVSRRLLDEQGKNLSLIGEEMKTEVSRMQRQLRAVNVENEEKGRQIVMLEDMVNGLTAQAERFKKHEDEDKHLLVKLGKEVETHRHDAHELQVENEELQRRVEVQRDLLQEKEKEIIDMEQLCNQREEELTDDIERMRARHNDFVDTVRATLQERDEEIDLLFEQCAKYEVIIDDVENLSQEQRVALRAKKREIEELSEAIERGQNSGLLGKLDGICTSKTEYMGTR